MIAFLKDSYHKIERIMGEKTLQNATDQQLLEWIVNKQQPAFAVLYDRFSRLLYGIIVAVVRDTDDAEDLLQDVFVQIWRNAATYQPTLGSPKTWLARIAHNRAIDMLRSKRYQQKKNEAQSLDGEEGAGTLLDSHAVDNVWQEMVQRDSAGRLSNALMKVSTEQRHLIELAFFHGYTHQEIAGRTGLPLGTVKTRIRAGMQSLRSTLSYLADEVHAI
jgi:RNA polymerase sigma-70 factor (ECF subfamily)